MKTITVKAKANLESLLQKLAYDVDDTATISDVTYNDGEVYFDMDVDFDSVTEVDVPKIVEAIEEFDDEIEIVDVKL